MANLATGAGKPNCDAALPGYNEGIPYAIATLGGIPNSYTYLDTGNSGWTGGIAPKMAELAIGLAKKAKALNPKAKLCGLATGVSNFIPFDGKYEEQLASAIKGSDIPARFIHDSARNGNAIPEGIFWHYDYN